MSFKIDNIRMKLESVDIDGDGNIDEAESVPSSKGGFMQIKDSTEMGEVMEAMNKDSEDTRDALSNINSYQHPGLVAVSFISQNGVISRRSSHIVTEIMRKAVSVDAMGRKQSVDAITGKKQNDISRANVAMGIKE